MSIEGDATTKPGFLRRNRWKLIFIALLAAVAGVFALWTTATLVFTYSEGDRIGYVQKFSSKGWVCRTWEGELAMTQVPGVPPLIFPFTVRDDVVAKRVAEAEGKKVALHYKEKRGVPSACFGDTGYFVSDIRVISP